MRPSKTPDLYHGLLAHGLRRVAAPTANGSEKRASLAAAGIRATPIRPPRHLLPQGEKGQSRNRDQAAAFCFGAYFP